MKSDTKLKDIAVILRRDSMMMTTKAGSGHPTTCMSCADIMSVLFFDEMRYDAKNPNNPNNDEFIMSKGHAAPILYSCLKHAGCIHSDLLSLRKLGSSLEGHPVPSSLPWIKVATGSLGQGLSNGLGMAIAARKQKRSFRTYVLLGDSEIAEGSNYEAFQLASYYGLGNLCAVLDMNRLGQSGPTMLAHDAKQYKRRFDSFGWDSVIIDGHDTAQIKKAFSAARKSRRPTILIAKTFKGKGVSFLEDKEGWHGKALNPDQLEEALLQLPDPKMPKVSIRKPRKQTPEKKRKHTLRTEYKKDDLIATRTAYGNALVKLAKDPMLIALDAEVKNSTHALMLKKACPKKFVECFIAEQNMIGMAVGLSKKGHTVFASTFAAFMTRAHDQIRMACLSSCDLTIVGSHAGISIGQDGGSQMGLSDLALFRALPGSSVFYPGDAVSAEKLAALAADTPGVTYVRMSRPKTPVIYDNDEEFRLGGFKVVRKSPEDEVVIVGAGVTIHEALKAYEKLKTDKISTAIVDCYCIKPFNDRKFVAFVKKHGNKVLVVEDHYPEGGLGEMIKSALHDDPCMVEHLAVMKMPHSGKQQELMRLHKIDAAAIVGKAGRMVRR